MHSLQELEELREEAFALFAFLIRRLFEVTFMFTARHLASKADKFSFKVFHPESLKIVRTSCLWNLFSAQFCPFGQFRLRFFFYCKHFKLSFILNICYNFALYYSNLICSIILSSIYIDIYIITLIKWLSLCYILNMFIKICWKTTTI